MRTLQKSFPSLSEQYYRKKMVKMDTSSEGAVSRDDAGSKNCRFLDAVIFRRSLVSDHAQPNVAENIGKQRNICDTFYTNLCEQGLVHCPRF